MIPDVTPNGVFYLPPTGWLTSFYNPPKIITLNNINRLFLPQNINGKEYHVSNENRLAIDSIIEELDHKIYRE